MAVLSVARAVVQVAQAVRGAQVGMQPAVHMQQPSVTDRRTPMILHKGGKGRPAFSQLAAMAVMPPRTHGHLTPVIKR
jgi:hypothetical protein